MTTNAVSGTNPAASLSSILSTSRSVARNTDRDGDSDSAGGLQGRGGTLFTALLAALTQFVASHSAGAATGSGTPGATAPGTTTGTTSTPAATTPATTTGGTTDSSAGAVPSTLAQDLHAFLHDLFRALRPEGHHRHEDDDSRHSHLPSTPVSTTPVSTPVSPKPVPTPATTTSTGTVTTPGVIQATPPATSPATTATTTADTGAATTAPVAARPGIARYGQRGLVAELTALIKDLADSGKASATASAPSRVSPHTLTDLNAAFARLIGDLGGTVPAASDTTAAATITAPNPDTSGLQSFLTSFLHDLQGSAADAGALGNGVNVTA